MVATLFERRQAGTVTGEEPVALVDGTCSEIDRRVALNKRRERGLGGESGHCPTKDGKRRRCGVQTRRDIATARRKRAREVRSDRLRSLSRKAQRVAGQRRRTNAEGHSNASRPQADQAERDGPKRRGVKTLAHPERLVRCGNAEIEVSQSGAKPAARSGDQRTPTMRTRASPRDDAPAALMRARLGRAGGGMEERATCDARTQRCEGDERI